MNHEESRNLHFDDAIPSGEEEVSFSVAVVVDYKLDAIRFLTGRLSPQNLSGHIVWYPLSNVLINTVLEIYMIQGARLIQIDWSPGQPFYNEKGEMAKLGYYNFDADYYGEEVSKGKACQELVVIRATAIPFEN